MLVGLVGYLYWWVFRCHIVLELFTPEVDQCEVLCP